MIGFVYRPPSSLIMNSWYEQFDHQVNQVGTSINCDAIIMGGFNVDANQFDKYARLDSLMTSYGYKQVITTPTRVTDDTASIIDHAYVNNVNKVIETAVADIAISDHSPIGITWCFSASYYT